MTITHYTSSSRGEVEIASMHYGHLANTVAKLQREQVDGEHQPTIDAMQARMAALDAEREAAEQ